MTTDDDRIAFLEGGDRAKVDASERAALDAVRASLADPSLWEEPPEGLEDSIVAAIGAEASTADAPTAEPGHVAPPIPLHRRRWVRPVLGAATVAAAAVVAFVLVIDRVDDTERLEAALTSERSPELSGSAELIRTDSGWRIELDAPNLPRLADGSFYQAWLRNDDGVLVAIGTFNAGSDVVLWAGVSPHEFTTITITRERADSDQSSSGERVLAGPITED